MSDENATETNSASTDDPEIVLSDWQFDSIYGEPAKATFLYIIGGRGSGKSYTDTPRVLHWSELATDLPFGIFANTDAQLHTVLAPIREMIESLGIDHRFEAQAPSKWRSRWQRQGIAYPPRRLRNLKFWIWEDATHIATGTLINNAYTRFKGVDMNAILIQEATEPGVTEDGINTLAGNLRCGKARKVNGVWRCVEPGHLHQMVLVANVPLNDPTHFIYRKVRAMKAREAERAKAGLPRMFVLLSPRTQDNPRTGESYLDTLRMAFDARTFEQQTSGNLEPNVAALTYHQFSEANILGSLKYDNTRPLHIWFDFNTTPGTAGWGHDLRYDEVPTTELRRGHEYFGVVGELFSDNDPMQTEQVARALLEDPTKDERCRDCGHMLGRHFESLWVCRECGNQCEGKPLSYEWQSSYLHLPPDGHGKPWRGLVNHRARIYVYADASGRNETVTGSALRILQNIFDEALGERVQYRIKDANPPIKLRELAVNRMLRAANGGRSLFVAPWCTAHTDDFREIVPDPKTGVAKKESKPKNPKPGQDYWKRTHETDGLGYMVDYRWPALIPQASGLPSGPEIETYEPFATGWREP